MILRYTQGYKVRRDNLKLISLIYGSTKQNSGWLYHIVYQSIPPYFKALDVLNVDLIMWGLIRILIS